MSENWGFGKSQRRMADHNAVVVGIGTDEQRKLRRLARFFRYIRIDLSLACDSDSRVGSLYDVRRDTGVGNLRVTYVIDEEGVVQGFHHNELSISSHWRWALQTVLAARGDVDPVAADRYAG